MKLTSSLAAALFTLFAFSTAHAATIDFEGMAGGTVLPSGFSIGDATFLSPAELLVTDIGTGNALCGAADGSCMGAMALSFETGARMLRFTFSGDVDSTTQYIFDINATVVFQGEVVELHQTGIAFANGIPLDEQLVQFENPNVTIMSIGIHSLDDTAFVIDNISYLPGVTAPVPEPSSWAMLMAGLGVSGMVLRRRSRRAAAV
ncbi:putative secreted protein with PEP-CTERM sorting signal [Pseudoduganella lurida]|uniref:Putative secreted protein with PEP-CTERM sorting signal n=2 Tax=Pseudoduganella lurida TaxID=1036180 RepID=A0A562RMC5_9BURK|nr:putative secreted protein with PEP-CTERM sorting signal [Pseudoduganella lurida]